MKLAQLEQSAFVLETDDGYTLAIDVGAYTPLEKLADISPDAMLISHLHKDHCSLEHIVKLAPKKLYISAESLESLGEISLNTEIVIIKSGELVTIGNSTVLPFDVDHGPNATVRPKENFGFLMNADGVSIYFAGDMFYPSGIDVTSLEADVVLVPVGGFYTFGPQEAIDFVRTFKRVSTVYPMHYEKTPEAHAEFVELIGGADFEVK